MYAEVDTPRRHVIVLLSDGQDTSSKQQLDTVLDLANRSNTAIYAVGLGERDEGGRLATFEAESALRRLAIQTGGRAFFPTDMEHLHSIYYEICRDLASQYHRLRVDQRSTRRTVAQHHRPARPA